MTSNFTSYIAPAIPVQIPVAYSPTDELLMLIGAATSGGAGPAPTYHVLVGLVDGEHVLISTGGDKVNYQ
tara:strand:+ start:1774 stop:1983 length:210 start_codon:yes stop_codon:yes gene_type:complete